MLKPVEAKSELGATFSLLPDDSILAGGANRLKDRYRVVLTLGTNIKLTAVRLEALTHDSLPNHGPGRSPDGNFCQTSWNVTAASPDGKDPVKLEFDQAWADHQFSDYPIQKNGYWNIARYQGRNATAIWSMAKPVSLAAGTKLTFEMQCQMHYDAYENLGHFRLSVSSDPAAIEHESKLIVTDPWQKLAAAYSLKGDQRAIDQLAQRNPGLAGFIGDLFTQESNQNWQRAVEFYNKGIMCRTTDVDLLSKRARAYEALRNWDATAADWSRAASGNPDGARLLGEFARRLAAAGQLPLAKAQFDQSEALYERSLREDPENDLVAAELAQLLFDKEANENRTRWTVLKPTTMKSEGGATLTIQADGAILASGTNPDRDVYHLTFRPGMEQIAAIRLEALPDPSLPHNGPGRFADNGNFHLNELRVLSGGKPSTLTDIFVDFDERQESRNVIDGKIDATMGWGSFPREGEANTAIVATQLRRAADDELKMEMYFSRAQWTQHNLGRFRLSISAEPATFVREQKRFAALKLTDPWAKLAVAYAVNGRNDEATRYFSRALQRSEGHEARKPILELAAHFGISFPP